MVEKKVKILVACHKPDEVYQDDVYTPIHVGRAISKYKNEMANMIGDDTGENISEKNPNYCELTAQYWAWKNIENVEYVGLCHYRRFFQTRITEENVDSIVGKSGVLCVEPIFDRLPMSLRLVRATSMEDFQIFMSCLKMTQPDYYETACRFLKKGMCVPFNMFVMKKELFDKFAEWQFAILEKMETYVRLSGYTRQRRLYGYFAEMLLPIFLIHNDIKIKFDMWVSNMNDLRKTRTFKMLLKNTYNRIVTSLLHYGLDIDYDAVVVGFKNDGIDIGYINK